jgi:hypothetical protein
VKALKKQFMDAVESATPKARHARFTALLPRLTEYRREYKAAADALERAAAIIQSDQPYGRKADADLNEFVAIFNSALVRFHSERRARSLQAGRDIANDQRKNRKDEELLLHFAAWQRKVCAALTLGGSPMSAAERVERYISTSQVKADRKKRRIRALLRAGRIPEL